MFFRKKKEIARLKADIEYYKSSMKTKDEQIEAYEAISINKQEIIDLQNENLIRAEKIIDKLKKVDKKYHDRNFILQDMGIQRIDFEEMSWYKRGRLITNYLNKIDNEEL